MRAGACTRERAAPPGRRPAGWVDVVPGAVLVRPDGYVPWAGMYPYETLDAVSATWFGERPEVAA
ncbi:aromatic-ring hydroxylase C-terminal domain-containing protein [Nonomuraea sp. H19]|uniref:aromatic-ring hydroxylase C-terminal domain-containing protein n=1 Tax=Nonomuraea sp. H19 TaxID=3452206 RepID=UPI003F8C3F07